MLDTSQIDIQTTHIPVSGVHFPRRIEGFKVSSIYPTFVLQHSVNKEQREAGINVPKKGCHDGKSRPVVWQFPSLRVSPAHVFSAPSPFPDR